VKPRTKATGHRVLSEAVAEHLQARILDGTLAAGDRLPPERDLAEQLHVNRSSVREALKKLEQLRLVEIQRGSGIRVRRLDEANFELVRRLLFREGRPNLAWIRDLLELREVVLLGLVRLGLERVTEGEAARLVELVDRATAPELADEEFADALMAVQDASARMTRNQVVMLLWNNLRRFVMQVPFEAARRQMALDRKELIPPLRRYAHAVAARDANSAVRATRDLLRKLERTALLAIREFSGGEPGDDPQRSG
jgi:GntR family transcriptional repressor for pyruvate dehydrogenase complex